MKPDQKKILLVQLFSNGDCLYATAVARQIKHDFPDCHLTWCIAESCARILELNPFVDCVRIEKSVSKNDVNAFRKFKHSILLEKSQGKWDEVFITHNADDNLAFYDGTIRGMILRAYPNKITVPLQPVLVLSESEKEKVFHFADKHHLKNFKNVILWEYAPQSGQSILSKEMVMQIAKKIVQIDATCVILSSANTFTSSDKIIDASILSIRENAELSTYCTLLIGCSSGITWLCTSNAGKFLPMVQLLDAKAAFLNAPSVDFKRYQLPDDNLIEMISFDEDRVYNCVNKILAANFAEAKQTFNEKIPLQFNTTRKVVYNMLCYLQFRAVTRHFKIIKSVYGLHPLFLKQFILAIVTFPFKLMKNRLTKTFRL